MSTDNFAYGNTMFPDLPFLGFGGLATPFGTLLPPGAKVAAYLRSTGPQDNDPPQIRERLVTSLATALKYCRDDLGDVIYVLPGHSEDVSDATMLDELADGTQIIGCGVGSIMPTFRWTATTSQWAIDNTDIVIRGLRLRLEGANGVVKAINVTGADCHIIGCDIQMASGASNKATIGIEVGTGADRFHMSRNRVRGSATHNVTDGVKIAAALDAVEILGNRMAFSATAANGLIHVTAAATELQILGNSLSNTHTASSATIAVDNVAATGLFAYNSSAVLNNGTANAQGIVFAGTATVRCIQNFNSDEARASGVITPAAVAT